jgi:hypothetical protein
MALSLKVVNSSERSNKHINIAAIMLPSCCSLQQAICIPNSVVPFSQAISSSCHMLGRLGVSGNACTVTNELRRVENKCTRSTGRSVWVCKDMSIRMPVRARCLLCIEQEEWLDNSIDTLALWHQAHGSGQLRQKAFIQLQLALASCRCFDPLPETSRWSTC